MAFINLKPLNQDSTNSTRANYSEADMNPNHLNRSYDNGLDSYLNLGIR